MQERKINWKWIRLTPILLAFLVWIGIKLLSGQTEPGSSGTREALVYLGMVAAGLAIVGAVALWIFARRRSITNAATRHRPGQLIIPGTASSEMVTTAYMSGAKLGLSHIGSTNSVAVVVTPEAYEVWSSKNRKQPGWVVPRSSNLVAEVGYANYGAVPHESIVIRAQQDIILAFMPRDVDASYAQLVSFEEAHPQPGTPPGGANGGEPQTRGEGQPFPSSAENRRFGPPMESGPHSASS